MTLSALIYKGGLATLATATPATLATQGEMKAATVAEVATVAVARQPEPPASDMTAADEIAIRAWLAHIEETDSDNIAEVLEKCRTDLEARGYFLHRAEEVPPPVARNHLVVCIDCRHFRHIEHPHLGHCAMGEPEAAAGLWDTDRRWCESYALRPDKPSGELFYN